MKAERPGGWKVWKLKKTEPGFFEKKRLGFFWLI